jgi:hypothetical protein
MELLKNGEADAVVAAGNSGAVVAAAVFNLGRIKGVSRPAIATILPTRNRPLLRHLGFLTWLEADPALLARRTAGNNDRPLLRDGEPPELKLRRLLEERGPLYRELADLRIQTDDLSQQESAYGVAESARVFFARRPPSVAAAAETV